MNFILKIVEGPNKGAEIALVEGVAVTLGKGDSCDIVLADATLPEEPVSLEPVAGGVSVSGEVLAPFHVKTLGATSFAAGPADAPWEALVWPKREEQEARDEKRNEASSPEASDIPPSEKVAADSGGKKHRGGCCGCIVAIILLLLAVAAVAWFFRADPRLEEVRSKVTGLCDKAVAEFSGTTETPKADEGAVATEPAVNPAADLAAIAAKYGLVFEGTDGTAKISGNLRTRRERLSATAEAYAAQPGVELDLSDDESLRTASEDALFTLTEGALKVRAATNRVVALSGVSPSPTALKKTLEALNADLPKLRAVDVTGVTVGSMGRGVSEATGDSRQDAASAYALPRPAPRKTAQAPSLPVCGILTTPYPCLVLKDGARIMEGATIGGSVILKIEADSVLLTNSAGRVTWKP